jgi:hypothetical protein
MSLFGGLHGGGGGSGRGGLPPHLHGGGGGSSRGGLPLHLAHLESLMQAVEGSQSGALPPELLFR